jgi:glucose-6-phosphate 1-epimerase
VVWNPHIARAAAIPDLGNDDWPEFICVETAAAATPIALLPGEQWTGSQKLTVAALDE